MTFRIQHAYDNDNPTPTINVGAYVRYIGADHGTGIIVAIGDSDVLDEKTSKVYHQRVYHVHWLDAKNPAGDTIYSFHAEAELAPSSRSVPKFATTEEAEAWMEKQVEPGNWTDKAQDATDSSADLDVALWKILKEEK